ncbi:U-box domain containing protein [Nitzschia inconspicua]|uniref:U-box domain containing protein n=1 Tax=Nitzschia inconspicua TaxID=303405 RepID=A0A9K3LQM3_9STRA|nr:U-box domain containing protein [Nitzschia inconspicua]
MKTESITSTSCTVVPQRFLCPLTLDIFKDPVLSKYGHTYERSAILQWLQDHETCPISRKPLTPRYLISNHSLKLQIKNWKSDSTTKDSNATREVTPPREFICPLTGKIFEHPVLTKDGRHYEHMALMSLVKSGMYSTDPMTGKPLQLASVVTDFKLMARIQMWKERSGNHQIRDTNGCYGWLEKGRHDSRVLVLTKEDNHSRRSVVRWFNKSLRN